MGWASGPVLEVGSDLFSGPVSGQFSVSGHYSDLGLRLGSNLEFVLSSLPLELVVHSSGISLVSEGGLELGATIALNSGHGPSLEESPLLSVQVGRE